MVLNVFPPRLSLQSRSLPGNPERVGTGLLNIQSNTVRRASTQRRQRLAGRTARIRLEVVPAPSSVCLSAVEKATRRSVEDRTFVDGDRGITSMRLPVVEKVVRRPIEDYTFVDDDGGTTSLRLATVERVVRGREEPSPARRASTGRFECGQCDVTISDPSVTASSVVLVTLTTNPGPVVVQYVSLQPQSGFTLHLTAPTTMGAPFNYVVL